MVNWTKFEPPKELDYDCSPEWQASYIALNKYLHTVISPGALLKMKTGRVLLVGDVNCLLGVCDCCTEFDHDDIESYSLDLVEVIEGAKNVR